MGVSRDASGGDGGEFVGLIKVYWCYVLRVVDFDVGRLIARLIVYNCLCW